jgi:hypothetical protein
MYIFAMVTQSTIIVKSNLLDILVWINLRGYISEKVLSAEFKLTWFSIRCL